jgi:hypothetical protein
LRRRATTISSLTPMDSPFPDVFFFPCSSTTDDCRRTREIHFANISARAPSRDTIYRDVETSCRQDHRRRRITRSLAADFTSYIAHRRSPAADRGGGGSGGGGNGGISIPRVTSGPSRMHARRYAAPRGTRTL